MRIQTFVVSPVMSNCYVMALDAEEGNDAVIVDPGDTNLDDVFSYIESNELNVVAVWNTHAHFDHVMGVDLVRDRYHVPAYVHKDDLPLWDALVETTEKWLGRSVPALREPDRFFADGDEVRLGRHAFRVWHTPGHSPGSVCLVGESYVFTGDTLFAGSVGRVDLPLSNPADMQDSLKRLLNLPDEVTLLPGHMQRTTMKKERVQNPFLRNL
jgi:hydroxyacylglutathione hydrolase